MGLDDIKYYLIGIVIFMVVIGGGVYILGSFHNADNSIDSSGELSQFNDSLYKASNITKVINDLDASINSVTSEKVGALGWLNALLGSAFNGLKLIGQSVGFMKVVASEAGVILGIPSFIISLLVLITIIIIAFAIYTAITRT